MDIHSGLYYGNMSAWVWWQGCGSTIDDFSLMSGTQTGKKYAVSKQYYHSVCPGAVRIKATTDDADFLVTAFENTAKGTHTIVIINSESAEKSVTLTGTHLLDTFKMYRTNSGSENCIFIKDVNSGSANSFAVPAKTIVTLQSGGDAL